MRTYGQPCWQLFSKRWPLSKPNRTKSVMNKYNVKHHRNSDTKKGNRDNIRTTIFERSIMNYWGAYTSFTRATSPSVTDVVQTFSWLFDLHDNPLTRQRIFTVKNKCDVLCHLDPIWICISLRIDCRFETRNYCMHIQAFVAGSFRVTDMNC